MIKKSRSDKYQAYYLEVSIDPFIIDSYSIYKGFDINIDSGASINNLAVGPINSDGSAIADQCGEATPAGESPPIGDR